MLKRGVIFLMEFLSVLLVSVCISGLLVKPYLRESIESTLRDRLGFKGNSESFRFYPDGRCQGERLELSGSLPATGRVIVSSESYSLSPLRSVLLTYLEDMEHFSWQKIPYLLDMQGFNLRLPDRDLIVFIPALHFEVDHEKTQVELDIRDLRILRGEHELTIGRLATFLNPDFRKPPAEWFEELRMEGLDYRSLSHRLDIEALRIQREFNAFNISASGRFDLTPLAFTFSLKPLGEELWQISGTQKLPFYERPIDYTATGALSAAGLWLLNLSDPDSNRLEVSFNAAEKDRLVSAWTLNVESYRPPLEGWASLHGKASGLFVIGKDETRMTLSAEGLGGGPRNTRNLSAYLEGRLRDGSALIEKLRLEEDKRWSARLSGNVSVNEGSLRELDLKLEKFPLDQYSPTLSGLLSARATCAAGNLQARIFSPELRPKDNPLRAIENFEILVGYCGNLLRFSLSALSSGESTNIEAEGRVPDLLEMPLTSHPGNLDSLRIRGGLFDLQLVRPIALSMNLQAVEVPVLQLQDAKGRLEHLSLSAH
ncbi:MAG: hypothetical protein HQL31_08000, partial [Planctomycetes bacterium]|nr:hypothetical protein [Planctomycetota bacterium]